MICCGQDEEGAPRRAHFKRKLTIRDPSGFWKGKDKKDDWGGGTETMLLLLSLWGAPGGSSSQSREPGGGKRSLLVSGMLEPFLTGC